MHGIPNGYRLQDGDLLSVDCGAFLAGWCGDAAVSFIVGTPDPVDQALIDATDAALARGIERPGSGTRWGTWPTRSAGQRAGPATGCSPTTAATASAGPCTPSRTCPTTAGPAAGIKLTEGLVIAIEPMLILGRKDDYYHDDDEWTLRLGQRAPRRAQRAHRCHHRRRAGDPDPAVTGRR